MMKVIRIIKDNTLGFVVGAILFGGIGTVVATTILSSTVSYTNNGQTNVESALNDLYNKTNRLDNWIDPNGINTDGIGGGFSFVYWNDNYANTTYSSSQVPTGTGLNGTYATRDGLATAYINWNDRPFYIKTTIIDGNITGHATCLWYNNHEFCMTPYFWDTNGEITKNKLRNKMEASLNIIIPDSNCNIQNGIQTYCYANETFRCFAALDGHVDCNDAHYRCYVAGTGNVYCDYN